ncbi:MAG: hypothetical protein V7637_241 [Mycobacteriales bacterium]
MADAGRLGRCRRVRRPDGGAVWLSPLARGWSGLGTMSPISVIRAGEKNRATATLGGALATALGLRATRWISAVGSTVAIWWLRGVRAGDAATAPGAAAPDP